MNRIRKHNGKFQVLVTPAYQSNSDGLSLMLGAWSDDSLHNYYIKEFTDSQDAQELAYNMPDINWQKLVLAHRDIFIQNKNIIRDVLYNNNFIVEFEPRITNSEEIKDNFFNRIMALGKRFKLNYDMNDVMGYHIINPWTSNLKQIYRVLKSTPELRIVRYEVENGIIRAIGETPIGTTYEIVLWPTLVAQWARWCKMNPDTPNEQKELRLKNILELQKKVDSVVALR